MRTGPAIKALPSIGAAASQGFFEKLLARLRWTVLPSFIWAAIGAVPGTIWTLTQSTGLIGSMGMTVWLCRSVLVSFASAFVLGIVLSIGTASGTDVARRPARFLAALTLGATCASGVVWLIDIFIPVETQRTLPHRMLDWWLTLMLFGAVFGWAAVLYLQRIEDQTRLASLLARRSVLSRQVAQSRVLAARAQIDPEMIARILRAVRSRYPAEAEDATALLDQLIGYLRLAMGRVRDQHTSLSSELALIRAYIALREIEAGKPVGLQIDVDEHITGQQMPVSIPLFLLARQMLEEALCTPAARVMMCIRVHAGQVVLTLETGTVAISSERKMQLRARLRELTAGSSELDILHHLHDSGVHRYVVQAAIH